VVSWNRYASGKFKSRTLDRDSDTRTSRQSGNQLRKRAFDLTVCLLASVFWVPLMALCALLIWCLEGRPVFYVSRRRVFKNKNIRLLKFRTMVKNADTLANRETVPLDGVRFLNIPPDSPLYTRTGRIIERFHLTELPQVLHIVRGDMTFIGNRPLPENVIACLRADFPQVEDRFLASSGLTGPVQLVGRAKLSDEDRLRLEIEYCRLVASSYSTVLDFIILAKTVLCVLGIQRFLHPDETLRLMRRYTETAPTPLFEGAGGVRGGARRYGDARLQVGSETASEPRVVISFEQSGNLVPPLQNLLHAVPPDRPHTSP
jgi:lipopolysaccharide/colanic/teichoic acid biosynthesis glycosyltransferase